MSIFNELKRRNIFRVAAAYIIVSWLLLQVSDTLVPALHLPEWFHSGVAFVLILGFPIALILAWAFELTPEGIKKEKDVDRSRSITTQTRHKLDYAIIALLAVALVYFIWESRFQNDAADQAPSAVETEEPAAHPDEDLEEVDAKPSIAVLPFENRSNREEDQFFTDGIHDDLLTTIAKIGSMKVISRTSVMEYKDTVKKIPEIAKELGVANILEGGIQRSGNQVRINVQLIDAKTDEHLWAEIYDRELTAENLFAIQSEISKAIVDALQATLSPDDLQQIDTMQTDNLQALEAYLRGRQLMATRDAEKLKLAVEEFNKAVELDPEFALAWVGVADSNRLYSAYARLDMSTFFTTREIAIYRALAINDRQGEAYASLATLHDDRKQDAEAEVAYKQAIDLSPNYASAFQWYAGLVGKDPLRSDESIRLLNQAAALDPRSSIIALNLAGYDRQRGLYSQAERRLQSLVEADPEFRMGHLNLIYMNLYELGRFDRALAQYQATPYPSSGDIVLLSTQAQIYLALGDLQATENIRQQMNDLDFDNIRLGFADIMINLHKNNHAAVREAINWVLPRSENNAERITFLAYVELMLGDETAAREHFLSVKPDWLELGKSHSFSELLNDGCAVSWVLINTGDVASGQSILQQSMALFDEILPGISEHPDYNHPEICYLAVGDKDRALQTIETKLAHNHLEGWDTDHKMPMYDLIRNEPRYQAALAERERKIQAQREAVAKMDL